MCTDEERDRWNLCRAMLEGVQFFLRTPIARSPEIRTHGTPALPIVRRLVAEDQGWVLSDATDHIFTFVSVCDTLHLDPDAVRAAFRRQGLLDSPDTIILRERSRRAQSLNAPRNRRSMAA